MRGPAVGALSYIAESDPDAVEPATARLLGLLDEEDDFVRGNAAWTLAYIAQAYPDQIRPAIPQLTWSLKSTIRKPVIHIFANIAKEEDDELIVVLPKFVDALHDDDPEIRKQACIVLGRLRDRSALDPLHDLRTDDDPEVRDAAETAIQQIKHG